MRSFYAAFIILWLGIALAGTATNVEASFTQPENPGPTVDWVGPENSSTTVVIAWDGAYNGQTEENWPMNAWVNDTDGVHTVIFMIRQTTESEWSNITPTMIDGNDTLGRYHYNYTYAVWWNYTLNRPQVEGTGGNFDLKIFANDSLGHWTETGILSYSGGYMVVNPPPEVSFMTNVLPSLVAASAVVTIIVVAILWNRRG